MRTDFEYGTSRKSQRVAHLQHRAEELERQLSDARTSLQRELGHFGYGETPGAGADHDFYGYPPAGMDYGRDDGSLPGSGDGTQAAAGLPLSCAAPHDGGDDVRDFRIPADTNGRVHAGGQLGAGGDSGADAFSAGGDAGAGPLGADRDSGADGLGGDGFGADGFGADGFGEGGVGEDGFADAASPEEERTEALVSQGRRSAYRPGWTGQRVKWIAAGAAVLALLVAVLLLTLTGGSASWPASVAKVQREIAKACQNPDVKSEPGQVNFACGKDTRQILWVFALMTSGNNAKFADTQTGRVGLEPITASQGGELAWSLNLHHPYDPFDPIDSLAVAARAINNIIGGATVTGANGNPVVQPGLENDPTNCLRYTGSAQVMSRKGFPGVCAKPITSPAGQASLVADVFQKWIVGAAPQTAQDAAVLFANAQNPGDSRVQAILKHLPTSKPLA